MLVLAQQVCLRVEPGIMYVAPLLVLAPGMHTAMDRLQASWARDILGCRHAVNLSWSSLRVQCGWDLRLSSKVVLVSIMAFARLQLLPCSHPGSRMLGLALRLPSQSWAVVVMQEMNHATLASPILSILSHPSFSSHQVEEARSCKESRKELLRSYRTIAVLPLLRERDQRLYSNSAAIVLPSLLWCRSTLLPGPEPAMTDLLDMDFGVHTWRFYRSWAIIRITGLWPTSCYAEAALTELLDSCPLCDARQVSVTHCVYECPSTVRFYHSLAMSVDVPARMDPHALLLFLFGPCAEVSHRLPSIEYVGRCVHQVLSARLGVPDVFEQLLGERECSSEEDEL